MSRKQLRTCASILLLLVGLLAASSPASSRTVPAGQSPALVRIAPTLSLVSIGGTTEVDVRVENVEDLFGFEAVIQFDSQKLHVLDSEPSAPGVQVKIGPFLKPADPSLWFVVNSVDNAKGEIHLAMTRMAPLGGVSGSGVLAIISLQSSIRGASPLTFSPGVTSMLDPSVNPLPFTLKSGGVLVGPVQRARLPLAIRR
jgi:hypothetical protein